MKILIGIAASEQNMQQRQAARYLSKCLNLKHSNIEQPVIDAAAAVLRIGSIELQREVDPHKMLSLIHTNLHTLKARIRAALCISNEFYLINAVYRKLTTSSNSKINNAFGGDIVSGIMNSEEAAFIRELNGVMLHIINDNSAIKTTLVVHDNDLMINVSNSDAPYYLDTLQALAYLIADRFTAVAAQPDAAA